MQKAYGFYPYFQCLGHTQCYDWFKLFQNDWMSTDDDPRSGRLSTSTDNAHVTKVNKILRSNRRIVRKIVRKIAEDCNISVCSCHWIVIEKLKMNHVVAEIRSSVDVARSKRQPRHHLSATVGLRK